MRLTWQKRRSDFNHDWLKNQYIPKLGTWMNILDEEIEDDDFQKMFITSVLPEWERLKDEALSLTMDFEDDMSPKVLFNEAPLSCCDDHTKKWLGDMVHMMWLERYSVNDLVSEAKELIIATTVAYENLLKAVSACDDQNLESLRLFRQPFAELLSSCRSLSKCFEKFPSEVNVC